MLGGALMLAALPMAAEESTRELNYTEIGGTVKYYGDAKAQTYDIAIHINNPALAGTKVTALSIPLREGATISNPQGWLSSELLVDSKKLNAPDIAVVDAELSDNNVLSVTFDEPYVIPAEGVYVGYSITIAKATEAADQYPNTCGSSKSTEGLYIHSTRTNKKWTSIAETYGMASALEVTLAGEFAEYAVSVSGLSTIRTDGSSNSVTIPLTVTNLGATEVNSLELSYAYGDEAPGTVERTFETPISAKFCAESKIEVSLPTCFTTTKLRVNVTKVNGQPNALADSYAEADYIMLDFVPTMRPLMEEYTGLWCGWCPRGWVAMEEMNEEFPEDFVCVSYHDGDMIQFLRNFPNQPSGYPTSFMNRRIEADPYYGIADDGFGMRELWLELRQNYCPADIETSIEWADGDTKDLVCKSKVKFVENVNGNNYRVQYVVVADGFKSKMVYNEDGSLNREESVILKQSNNYNSYSPLDDSDLWSLICGAGATLTDLVYNDVAMTMSPVAGEAAFPAEVVKNNVYENEVRLNYSSIKGVESGVNVLPEDGKLRCVAVLLTADGKFVNCNKSSAIDVSAVREVMAAGMECVSTEWFDLQGRRVENPASGMFIRIDRMADGAIRTTKVIR